MEKLFLLIMMAFPPIEAGRAFRSYAHTALGAGRYPLQSLMRGGGGSSLTV
ncbi:hypothetical protein [Mucilaginibacter dorajii]|uniref:hypothetical protein n=1 Tax=Mucilaginibacter dorajii TaxID=692994 RepID=UPI002168F1DB|nr:hypothetical protein [Mucilaginibacter dorajii]MCS3737869.1 hypothetical protein [Mucilaginibacter dorajii]